jgi:hypothetical protein
MVNLGRFKSEYWSFQMEQRFVLIVLPIPVGQADLSDLSGCIVKCMRSGIESSREYYDMKLSESAFRDMRITLNPACSDADRIIAESLIGQFAPDANIINSVLYGKIRR